MTPSPRFTVVFALFDRVTQLDFTGPYEVFWRLPQALCVMASTAGGEIRADGGLTISGVQRLADVPHADLVCVPGGFGVIEAMADAAFLGEVKRLAADARYVTSVCSGSLVLGAAGLLQGKRAACHWAWRELLPPFGATVDEGRVVRDGRLITGGGVTAGIDMALTVMADIAGDEQAQAVQLGIEYAPAPPFDAGRPERAAPGIVEAVTRRLDQLRGDRHAAVRRAALALAGSGTAAFKRSIKTGPSGQAQMGPRREQGSVGLHRDPPGARPFGLGQLDPQHAVAVARLRRIGLDRHRQRHLAAEAAVGALHHAPVAVEAFPVETLFTGDNERIAIDVDVEVFAPHAGRFDADDQPVVAVEHVRPDEGPTGQPR